MSLTFDAGSHTYRWQGTVVPSVTQILQPLVDFSRVPADVLKAASAFGTAVHKACELDDLGDLEEALLDPALAPYLAGWRKFRREHASEWDLIEQPLFNPSLRYAGTPDRIGRVDGVLAVVDIKSSSTLLPAVGPQTAAYARAYSHSGAALQRFGVRLFPNGYELKQYSDPLDWPTFASLVTVRQFCERHFLKEISYV